MTKNQLLESAASLPEEDRIDLVLDLWDTIDGNETPLTDSQKDELDRRIAGSASDTGPSEEWDLVRARLLRGEF